MLINCEQQTLHAMGREILREVQPDSTCELRQIEFFVRTDHVSLVRTDHVMFVRIMSCHHLDR